MHGRWQYMHMSFHEFLQQILSSNQHIFSNQVIMEASKLQYGLEMLWISSCLL